MANTTFTKRNKTFLPDIKRDGKKASDPLQTKELTRNLGLGKTQRLGESYLNVRGHIVPGCSQIHSKSSDSSEILSEEDLIKKRNSKLRTMKVQPATGKTLLMEKFESSLKERLLSSANFSKQVPLFDSTATKDKVRKVSSVDEDLSKNESMYNAVFPARKDTGKSGSPGLNDQLFSKHNRESQDWLKQIEDESQKDNVKTDEQRVFSAKGKIDLKKASSSSKKIKKILNKPKEENIIQTELNSGPLEQLKFLSSPRLSSRVGEKGSSRSKIAKEKYSSLKLNLSDSRKATLPKLSSKNTSKEASKNVILENQKTMESNALDKMRVNSLKLLEKSSTSQGGKTNSLNAVDSSGKRNEEFSTETLKDLSQKKLSLCINSSSDFNDASADNMEITFKERDPSEMESVEIYGEHGVAGIVHRGPKALPSLKGISQSTSLETDKSSSFSSKTSLRHGGPMGVEDLMHYNEYNVLFFETVKDSSEKTVEETTPDISPTETTETLAPPVDLPVKDVSNVTLALVEDHGMEVNPVDEIEEEELPKEMKEGEEDCKAEPCNEPQWFEDYGIDKKSRKEMGEEVKSEESLEDDVGEAAVTIEEDVVQEVVHDDEDVMSAKKKKVRKVRPTDEIKEQEEAQEVIEEVEEFESETVREIKTIPLVTIDLIPEKERPVVEEKPLSQMPSEYLKKYVGKYLVAGLAQVALHMPTDPVEYLAHWLIKERKRENLLEEFKQFKSEVKEIRKKNIDELRRKLQMDYLQDEALKRYQDGKFEPLYPTFDSSESELEMEETGKQRGEEEVTSPMTELDD